MDYIYTVLEFFGFHLLNPVVRDIPSAIMYFGKCLVALWAVAFITTPLLGLVVSKDSIDRNARISICWSGGYLFSLLLVFLGTLYLFSQGKIRTYLDLVCPLLLFGTFFIIQWITLGAAKGYENALTTLRD